MHSKQKLILTLIEWKDKTIVFLFIRYESFAFVDIISKQKIEII